MDCFPLPQGTYTLTSGFRTRNRPGHNGVDYAAPEGTPLFAPFAGTITVPAEEPGGAGKNIWIRQGDRWVKYFHLAAITAVTGQEVEAGEIVGAVGHTGRVLPPGPDGAHLHVEVHDGGPSNPIDPTDLLGAAETAGRFAQFTPAGEAADQEEDTLNDDDREWIAGQINQLRDDLESRIDWGAIGAAAKGAELTHQTIQELANRLGVDEPLPTFSVNDEPEGFRPPDDDDAQAEAEADDEAQDGALDDTDDTRYDQEV